MLVDWGLARQIGGIGFGLVFIVLIILSLVIWLVGFVINRISASKIETGTEKKGE